MQHLDKAQHLLISLAGVVLIVLFINKLPSSHRNQAPIIQDWVYALRYPLAFSLAYVAGVIKEVGDGAGWWPGNLDLGDLLADLLGCVLGLFAAMYMERRVLGNSTLLPL